MIRIAIVDDHQLVREGIKKIVGASTGIMVVGEATDLTGTLRLLDHVEVDVLLLDLCLHDAVETQTIAAVRDGFPLVPVLVLSLHPEERSAIAALRAGAAGYICKASAASEVATGIYKIAAGGRYITPRVAELLGDRLSRTQPLHAHRQLTSRETEVFQLLGAGASIKQTAAQLKLSISSINTYRIRILYKLQLKSNAALIRYAVENGLTD